MSYNFDTKYRGIKIYNKLDNDIKDIIYDWLRYYEIKEKKLTNIIKNIEYPLNIITIYLKNLGKIPTLEQKELYFYSKNSSQKSFNIKNEIAIYELSKNSNKILTYTDLSNYLNFNKDIDKDKYSRFIREYKKIYDTNKLPKKIYYKPEPKPKKYNILRINKELSYLDKNPHKNCIICPINNIFNWSAIIIGPNDSPFQEGIFNLNIEFPHNYPFYPPQIIFLTKIYHPNISSSGNICLDILKEKWTPALNINTILLYIYSLLNEPNPNNSPVQEIADLYINNRDKYEKIAREWTHIYAIN